VTTKLTWTRLTNGNQLCNEHPIKLEKPWSRSADSPGWVVRVPYERDVGFADGWQWRTMEDPEKTLPVEIGGGLEGANLQEAKHLVSQHLDYILAEIPPDYGQPEPEPEDAVPVWDSSASSRLHCSANAEPAPAPGGSLIERIYAESDRETPDDVLTAEPWLSPHQVALELREVILDLSRSIDEFRQSVPKSVDAFVRTRAPEQVRDVNGRPVLADLLAAKANALAALSRLVND
jgi:hypothetical protein